VSWLRAALLSFVFLSGAAQAGDKRIALTFDDAPRADGAYFSGDERAAALISALRSVDSPPVLQFVTTQGFDLYPGGRERIETYAAAGHLIANHSHTHPWLNKTDTEAYLADLDEAEERLKGIENLRPWFRFPFLDEGGRDVAKRDAVRAALAERGLMSGYVTIDTYDWHMERRFQAVVTANLEDKNLIPWREAYVAMVVDAAEHYERMAEAWLGRQPAQVLLLHENDLAALFIDDAISALREAGWEVISPDEAYDDPLAEQLPETTFSGMGRISALAFDGGARGAEVFDHWSADEQGIDDKLTSLGIKLVQDPN